ncbi:MAG TPA: hypothetical protein VHJ17_16660 [Thermomonospora sp.]|nr:hypothetical protein [Thermomonospora sp.]
MRVDRLLARAAAGIAAMPEEEFAVGLERLEAEAARRRADDLARARQAAFLDTLDLERAAYELGRRYDREGDARGAARWYRVAARHDHADAALRLGGVLDTMAERYGAEDGSPQGRRHELRLIGEAARAYAEAYAAGHPEAADRLDRMLASFGRRRRVPSRGTTTRESMSVPERCSYVRDFAPEGGVLREEEIQRLSRHAAQCLTCMEHFVALVRAAATRVPSGTVAGPPAEEDAPRAPAGAARAGG